LQERVLSHLIGEEKAAAWRYIMTNEKVRTPEGATVTYNCGQPMGAYSS
jgi:hypothetical protein